MLCIPANHFHNKTPFWHSFLLSKCARLSPLYETCKVSYEYKLPLYYYSILSYNLECCSPISPLTYRLSALLNGDDLPKCQQQVQLQTKPGLGVCFMDKRNLISESSQKRSSD